MTATETEPPAAAAETSPDVRRRLSYRTAACGIAMGAADIVPGVSGGTIALILGVYQRLIEALNRFDSESVGLLVRGQWKRLAHRVDAGFLALLGGGIAVAVVVLSGMINHLLQNHREVTYAAFFGLIAASGIVVGRLTRPTSSGHAVALVALGAVAAVGAAWLTGLSQLAPRPGLPYTFICGAIAISAMILPGISGAYLLLLLGKYEEITDILHRAPKLQVSGAEIATVAVFAVGCLVGLLAFSRLLRWLLARHWSPTMAVLCGFMIGSLRRVWPFQRDTTPDVEKFKLKIFEPYVPDTWSGSVTTCVLVAAAALVLVLVVDAVGKRSAAAA